MENYWMCLGLQAVPVFSSFSDQISNDDLPWSCAGNKQPGTNQSREPAVPAVFSSKGAEPEWWRGSGSTIQLISEVNHYVDVDSNRHIRMLCRRGFLAANPEERPAVPEDEELQPSNAMREI